MKQAIKTSILTTTFLLTVLLVPLLSVDVANAGWTAIGCCVTDVAVSQCLDCPEGETCVASVDYCKSQGGLITIKKSDDACTEIDGSAMCAPIVDSDGCCVIDPGNCMDDVDTVACFDEISLTSDFWVFNTRCSEVPQCTVTRNVPAISNIGLLALAGVFILLGVWAIARKRTKAL